MLDAEDRQQDCAFAPDGLERALAIAYRYLNRRERTRAEMRAHLESKGIATRDVEDAMSELAQVGQLDDVRFARLFVQDKRELEEWGSDRIRQVLLARGLEPELIEEELAEQEPDGEIDQALALLHRRFPSPPWDRRERERALAVLVRKGYDTEVALDAITLHLRGY